jgi:phage gpG-like protein
MVNFNFTIEGEEQVGRMLSRVTDKIDDLAPFWEAAGSMLVTTVGEQFDTQGGRTGGWAPLSPQYAIDKARKYGSQPILVASGAMRASLMGGSGNISRQIPEGLVFGTDVSYARYHQTGTSRMPQRRILDLTSDDRRAMMKLLQRHLFGAKL